MATSVPASGAPVPSAAASATPVSSVPLAGAPVPDAPPGSGGGFVRAAFSDTRPPPGRTGGVLQWLRANLFSSPLNTGLTLLLLYVIATTLPDFLRFTLLDAIWEGEDRDACRAQTLGREPGACWAFVKARTSYFMYGQYPLEERWRVDLTWLLGGIGVAWLLWPRIPRKAAGAAYFFIAFPLLAFVLLTGWGAVGLPPVPTYLWGGLLVTLVISAIGIVVSLPLGVLLALGRRSRLPAVKFLSVVFIEFVRGVPLITVLFMANVMLPLFLPGGWRPDALVRVLIGVALFAAAYMAEVVRGGLQAIPKGQYEGAMSLGLGYWHTMALVILPQALKIVIPGIVNTFIGLFKDTSLVSIVGIFDLMRTVEASLTDPKWATPVTRFSGYFFAALVYFVFCFAMSRYSMWMERRLATGHRS